FTLYLFLPPQKSRLSGQRVVVPVAADRQEVLEFRSDFVSARQCSVFIGQRRAKRVALHVGVVALLERTDEASELLVGLHLRVDLGEELPAFLAKAVAREDQAGGDADDLKGLDRSIRMFGVGQIVRNQEHKARYRVTERGQPVF